MALLRRVYLPREFLENFLLKDIADSKINLLLIASLILAASVPAIIVVPLVPALARAADSLHWSFAMTAEEPTG